ncbi:MAG: hypothetical protein HYZ53_17640 [Planctomycetes bacterium]|nr:hypothetical protein [Planctomycetota bacterium]
MTTQRWTVALFVLGVASACSGEESAYRSSNYYREMYRLQARPAVERIFSGAAYVYRDGDHLALLRQGYHPGNFISYNLASHSYGPLPEALSAVSRLQRLGSVYDNPQLPIVDLSPGLSDYRYWASGRVCSGVHACFHWWSRRAGLVETRYPRPARGSGMAAFYGEFFVIGTEGGSNNWEEAGLQVYDRGSGELLWQDIPKRHSTAWAFHADQLYHVSTGSKGGVCEARDLKSGRRTWALSIRPSQEWLDYDPELAKSTYDLPCLSSPTGQATSMLVPPDGTSAPVWLIATEDGVFVCLGLDGTVRWVHRSHFALRRTIRYSHMVPLDPNWLTFRSMTTSPGHLWVVDAQGVLHCLSLVDGREVSSLSASRPIICPPLFRGETAVVITETEIIEMPVQCLTWM